MAVGPIPTVIAGPAVLVAVRIGVTELVPPVTYTVLPLGVIAMPKGWFPTVMAGPAVLVAVRIGVTVSPAELRT